MPHDVRGAKVDVYKKTLGGKSNFDIPNQSTSKKITGYSVNSGKTYYTGLRLAAWADALGLGISGFSDFSSKNDSGYPYDGYARFKSMALKLR